MAQVGVARLRDRVVVVLDHVVEHAHRRGDGLFELVHVEAVFVDVLRQVDRAEVADRDFVVVGVQRDLGAEIGAVHHADVLVGVADVAGVLEGDPRVTGLEQHAEHLAPQVDGLERLEDA